MAALQAVIYSASMVESVMQDYFILLYTTDPSFRVNTDPDIDLLEFIFVWKSKSVYPIIFRSVPKKKSI